MIEIPVRVKEALETGFYLKNYRFLVLDDDGKEEFVIDNHSLVSESVSIDERLCSEDTIKFGLCEGSQLQFEYFGFTDIKGRRIQAYMDVQYKVADNTLQWYPIPIGFFEVKECVMQFSTGIRKCSCFNKLYSQYLDAKADASVQELVSAGEFGVTGRLSVYTLLKTLLLGYSIEEKTESETQLNISPTGISRNVFSISAVYSDGTSMGGYWKVYMISAYFVPKEFGRDEFFSFDIFAKQIYQKLKEKGIILSSRYTGVNGIVYSLEEYSKTNYNNAKNMGGFAILDSVSGSNIFKTEFAKVDVEKITTGYVTNISNGLQISIPVKVTFETSVNTSISTETANEMEYLYAQILSELSAADGFHMCLSPMEKYRLTVDKIEGLSDITIRKLQTAVYETQCLYGRLDRESDLFSGIELNHARRLPAQTLYPENSLYPLGSSVRARKSTYRQLWTEDGNVKKFHYLIITYKALDEEGNETERKLQRTVNTDGNTNYNMSDNWLFRNLVWTEEEIAAYAEIMVEKMKNITWFPFEMWCAGLPFIESGDEIEIPTPSGSYTTYILQRQMKGIQDLSDNYINGTVNIF